MDRPTENYTEAGKPTEKNNAAYSLLHTHHSFKSLEFCVSLKVYVQDRRVERCHCRERGKT